MGARATILGVLRKTIKRLNPRSRSYEAGKAFPKFPARARKGLKTRKDGPGGMQN